MRQTPPEVPVTGRRPPDRQPLVEARHITKRYGPTVALDDAGVTVPVGESHALVGRNGAGKSTLVRILTGLLRPDSGSILYYGEPAPDPADREAWRRRVACVHQSSMVFADLSVAENLFLGRYPTARGPVISWRRMRRAARALLDEWGVPVDEARPAGGLSVEDTKLVEIARSLSHGARFIILDEPTAQLDSRAIDRLFRHMRRLQGAGVTFLYISHHLEEIYQVCHAVTVFRDGRRIITAPVGRLPRRRLIAAMTGEPTVRTGEPGALATERLGPGPRPATDERPSRIRSAAVPDPAARSAAENAPILVEIEHLSGPHFRDVSLAVRAGEVVGLTGLAGSGSHQVAEALAGLHRPTGGRITVLGHRLRPGDVRTALAAGVGCLPRDRLHQGFVPELSVAENTTMTISDRLGPLGLILSSARDAFTRRTIAALDITAEGPHQPVSGLSGGNQQKVVMGRALATDPKVLVLINPTAGVDVQSKRALISVVDRARSQRRAVLLVSDQLDDLKACDRVLVMFNGSQVAEHPAGWTDHTLVASIEGVALSHE